MGQHRLSSLIHHALLHTQWGGPLSCLSFWGPLASGHKCWLPSLLSETPGQLRALREDACSVTAGLRGLGSQVPRARVLTLEDAVVQLLLPEDQIRGLSSWGCVSKWLEYGGSFLLRV